MRLRQFRVAGLVAIATIATAGGPVPGSPDVGPAAESETCSFSITARNDRNVDVVVFLYDSRVHWGIYSRQLKIQNHRIAPGKTMRRTYKAPGRCGAKRSWLFVTRLGGWKGTLGTVGYKSDGDSTDGRNVDLGRTTRWRFPG